MSIKLRRMYQIIALLLGMIIIFGAAAAFGSTAKNNKEAVSKVSPRTAMLESGTNRHTRLESYKQVENRLTFDGYQMIMEDDKLEVWLRDSNASIRVKDKATGYIWGGLDSDKPEGMNTTWSGIGNALVSIDYFDNKGLERRVSIADKDVDKKYSINGSKLNYSVDFTAFGIAFDFEVELNDGRLIFKMEGDSIQEKGNNSLAAVYFVPFLGSTLGNEIDGYIFVPDGPGALIRFDKPFQYLITYNKRIYGTDYGIDSLTEINDLKSSRPNDFTTDEQTIMMPVYGMVHGVKQNAWFAVVDKGAEYASIMATPSGVLTNYNWVTNKFIYRQKYLQPTSKSGAGVQIAQKDKNIFDAQVTYYFLNDNEADYVGMAKFYRSLLQEEGQLVKGKDAAHKNIPLQLDIITADIQKGFLFSSVLNITPLEQIKQMAAELRELGIDNLSIGLKGWQKGGLNGSKPSEFKFESKLGTQDALNELSKFIADQGGSLYFYENPVTVNETQIDFRKEAGNSLSQALIKTERDNPGLWFKDTYYLKSNLVADYIKEKAEKYKDHDMSGMALGEFGSKLYAENQRDQTMTRLEARTVFEDAAQKAAEAVERLGVYKPNQYLWKYTDDIFNIPMLNSQYLFETDTVPFLQIVLKGNIDYYAPYSNMSYYSRTDILKLIEYGSYPAFLLTGKKNHELEDTAISELYSTAYEDWKYHINAVYHEVNNALTKVEGMMISDRTVLSQGIVRVSYDGGVSVIVNYTGKDYLVNGATVPAFGYTVLEGDANGN